MRPCSWSVLLLLAAAGCGEGKTIIIGRTSSPGAFDGQVALDAGQARDAAGDPSETVRPEAGLADSAQLVRCRAIPLGIPSVCMMRAAEDAAVVRVKWSYSPASPRTLATHALPLVASLTDDDGDGRVDLCDMPDVVVMERHELGSGRLLLLSGDRGVGTPLSGEALRMDTLPAIADLNLDGTPEIIAESTDAGLIALSPRGEVLWRGDFVRGAPGDGCEAIAVYDLDADGQPELLAGDRVFDRLGRLRFEVPSYVGNAGVQQIFGPPDGGFYVLDDAGANTTGSPPVCRAPSAADLDGDGQLEALFGHVTVDALGAVRWGHRDGTFISGLQTANLDHDPEPELLTAGPTPPRVLDARGNDQTSFLPGPNVIGYSTVEDFDGDGRADIASAGYGTHVFVAPGQNAGVLFEVAVGRSAVGAFDFRGVGRAQAIVFGDVSYIVDIPTMRRDPLGVAPPVGGSGLLTHPVVADADNDGSADLLVIAELGGVPTLVVYEDAARAWVGTRRIWNQAAYHITNVEEDGTIPRRPMQHWKTFNTFRSNAQQEDGRTCIPLRSD